MSWISMTIPNWSTIMLAACLSSLNMRGTGWWTTWAIAHRDSFSHHSLRVGMSAGGAVECYARACECYYRAEKPCRANAIGLEFSVIRSKLTVDEATEFLRCLTRYLLEGS
jgi:hypothetical protein